MNHATQRTHRDETLFRLQRILHALAMSDERQKALFPDFVVLGDELALEFDNWYHVLVAHGYHEALPAEGRALLSEIDGVFGRMVDAHEHVWSTEELAEREGWATMRHLAAQALQILGWPQEDPGSFKDGSTDC